MSFLSVCYRYLVQKIKSLCLVHTQFSFDIKQYITYRHYILQDAYTFNLYYTSSSAIDITIIYSRIRNTNRERKNRCLLFKFTHIVFNILCLYRRVRLNPISFSYFILYFTISYKFLYFSPNGD